MIKAYSTSKYFFSTIILIIKRETVNIRIPYLRIKILVVLFNAKLLCEYKILSIKLAEKLNITQVEIPILSIEIKSIDKNSSGIPFVK